MDRKWIVPSDISLRDILYTHVDKHFMMFGRCFKLLMENQSFSKSEACQVLRMLSSQISDRSKRSCQFYARLTRSLLKFRESFSFEFKFFFSCKNKIIIHTQAIQSIVFWREKNWKKCLDIFLLQVLQTRWHHQSASESVLRRNEYWRKGSAHVKFMRFSFRCVLQLFFWLGL